MVRRTGRIIASSVLAIVGGFLVAVGGVANHSFLLSLLSLLGDRIGAYVSGMPLSIIILTIYAVSILIGLGGLTVMMGGVLVFTAHTSAGRLLIALGGSAGFLGLLISFGYTSLTAGLDNGLNHSAYWVGLVMSVVARRLAKKA